MKITLLIPTLLILLLTACSNHTVDPVLNMDSSLQSSSESLSIPGSDVGKLKETLEVELGISMDEESIVYTSPNTQNTYSLLCDLDESQEVIQALFLISYGKTQSEEDFIRDAREYFTYCASVPYDTADVDAAISFVEEFIESYVVSENKEEKETKTIGDATFQLYGKKANKQHSHLSLSIFNSKVKLS